MGKLVDEEVVSEAAKFCAASGWKGATEALSIARGVERLPSVRVLHGGDHVEGEDLLRALPEGRGIANGLGTTGDEAALRVFRAEDGRLLRGGARGRQGIRATLAGPSRDQRTRDEEDAQEADHPGQEQGHAGGLFAGAGLSRSRGATARGG